MINYTLLDSRNDLNPFTENLELLIRKSTPEIGYAIRTRRGTVIWSNDLEIRTNYRGNRIFSAIDNSQHWWANGSCFYASYIDDADNLMSNDLITSEQA